MPSADVARQPLQAPLNDAAKMKLAALQRKYADNRDFSEHLRTASQLLSETVNPMSTRKVEKRAEYKRNLQRAKDKDGEIDSTWGPDLDAFEARVESVTEKMDHAIRRIIDDRVWNEDLNNNLKHVTNRATNAAPATQTQRSILPTQDATPQRRDPDNEDEDEAESPAGPPAYEDTPTALLAAAFTAQSTRHASKTLTDRYAHDNDYAGWYRSRHDGLHSINEHPPPVPNPVLWFGREEGRASPLPGDEDTNLEVTGERISLKCPLTTMDFVEPLTSDVCGHSFEKAAVLEVLRKSEDQVPFTPDEEAEIDSVSTDVRNKQRQRLIRHLRTPRLECPVYGCNKYFIETDLRANPILQRQVARYKEKKRLEEQRDQEREARGNGSDDAMDVEEDDEDDDDDVRVPGTQRRPLGLGSSPAPGSRMSGAERIKREELARTSGLSGTSRRRETGTEPPRGTQRIEMSDGEESD